MRQLAFAQMFTWFALFAFFIYATAAVTSHHYRQHRSAERGYNLLGPNWVGVLMAVYNGVRRYVAFALPVMARSIGRVGTHAICSSSRDAGWAPCISSRIRSG